MECEIKLTAQTPEVLSLAFDDAIITQNAVGTRKRLDMHSVYYDFNDHSLWRAGVSLRFRTENNAGRITLKTKSERGPAGIKIRNEWEVPCASVFEGLAALRTGTDVDMLLEHAVSEKLFITAEVNFSRILVLARVSEALIEFALDDGFFNGDINRRFTELEAELKSGGLDELGAVSAYLISKYGLRVENSSKLARALAFRNGL